jgi:hypothetical protein
MTTSNISRKIAHNQKRIERVPSAPAKSFFVSMLTRDIDLQDAILDLLDNCVDGALRDRPKKMADEDSLDGYWAHIKFDEETFSIEDNCGGIPWDIAKEYAFCMGRPEDAKPEKVKGQIGVVGIGMKRAIFKMGRDCLVHSHHRKDTFLVTIPPDWFRNDRTWDFFDARPEKPVSKAFGTTIEISDLEEPARNAFQPGSSFRRNFPTEVAKSYSYLIEKGFTVKIGGERIEARPVRLFFEREKEPKTKDPVIRPYVYQGKINGVDVFMAVGYRSPMLTEEEQERAAKTSFAAKDAGWTIVCNDRVVLSSDQSVRTGWGVPGIPNFHNQFACIAGIVEFRSDSMINLPITTTKRGIDAGSDTYMSARIRMQEGLKHFTSNTNRWKGYEQDLKGRFERTKILDLREIKRLARKLPMSLLPANGNQKQYKPNLPVRKKSETTRRISFLKEMAEIEQVSQHLFGEARLPSEVGEKCFDQVLAEAKK